MKQLLNKIGIKGTLQKNFGAIVILAFTGSVIFGLPFFRFEYYDAYISTYHLTNTQMESLEQSLDCSELSPICSVEW